MQINMNQTETLSEQTSVRENLNDLLAVHEPPCLTLYLPTHRCYPENQQDPIRFKNLVKSLQDSLHRGYETREVSTLLEPFQELADDRNFWSHTWDGVAVFSARGLFRVTKLQQSVPELALVAGSFHIKPLLRSMQAADRYQVLCVNRREIQLFEGNRDRLDAVELAPAVPRTTTEALGDEIAEAHAGASTHGGPRQGQGTNRDEIDIKTERFFRAVDRPLQEHHSRPSGLPLILVALAEYQSLFRRVSSNPLLTEHSIEVDPGALSVEQLRQRAWEVMQPTFHARLQRLNDAFGAARAKGLGTDDPGEVAQAAVASRIDTLLVEAERHMPAKLDEATGTITLGTIHDPQVDDLLDDLAELVIRRGGTVVVVPAGDMPTATGVAATFRF